MPTAKTAKKKTVSKKPATPARPAAKKTPAKAPAKASGRAPAARLSLAEAMSLLEKAGSEQTRKTYTRHGAKGPMFGVSFATFKTLVKRIGVDHDLAVALWDTGNFDARILGVKVADPGRVTPGELDRWARDLAATRMCAGYVGMLAAESPHAAAKLTQWMGSKDQRERNAGWVLLGQLSQRDTTLPDAIFENRLAEIERSIHTAPNEERDGMNMAVITIGCRNEKLRKLALAAAKRIGKVDIDFGDTACKTPDAADYIEKSWAHAKSKGFESPAAQERGRENMRTRC